MSLDSHVAITLSAIVETFLYRLLRARLKRRQRIDSEILQPLVWPGLSPLDVRPSSITYHDVPTQRRCSEPSGHKRDGNRICPQTERNGIKRDYAFINLDGGSRNCFNDLVALHTRENAWTLANYQENLAKQLSQAAGNLWRGKNLHKTCNACRQMLGKLGKSVLDIRLFKV